MGLTEEEKQALRYAGLMGHRIVVLDNRLRIRAELDHVDEQARAIAVRRGGIDKRARVIADAEGGVVYERTDNGYKKVYDGKKSGKENGG